MFAPYCASCESRVLLGTGRIVRFTDPASGRLDVVLRCWCGADVPADAKAPVEPKVPVEAKVPVVLVPVDVAPVDGAPAAEPVPAARAEYATHAVAAC